MLCHGLPSAATGKAISFVTTATISACGHARQWQLSLALLEDRGKSMKSKRLDLGLVTFTSVLVGFDSCIVLDLLGACDNESVLSWK